MSPWLGWLGIPCIINLKITCHYLLLIFFSLRTVATGFKQWHFLCVQWNGIAGTVTYFYDGYAVDSKIQDETLKTQLPPGKNFNIGLGDGTGKLTQLNIWDYEIAAGNVVAMSSGGFNVHGSVMSWCSLVKYVPSENINWNSEIHLPGKRILISSLDLPSLSANRSHAAPQLWAKWNTL